MSVSLTAMRDELRPGIALMFHAHEPLQFDDVPAKFPHLRAVFDALPVRKVGDLIRLPNRIEVGGVLYETTMEFVGREYPQGWGRLTGGAAAEPESEADGKVDTFRYVDNANMIALKKETMEFLRRYTP